MLAAFHHDDVPFVLGLLALVLFIFPPTEVFQLVGRQVPSRASIDFRDVITMLEEVLAQLEPFRLGAVQPAELAIGLQNDRHVDSEHFLKLAEELRQLLHQSRYLPANILALDAEAAAFPLELLSLQ